MKREIHQYTISFEPAREPDPREFSSATEVAHHCVDNSGRQHKDVAIAMNMSSQLLTMKLHGNTAFLTADEYDRLAEILGEKGILMRKYHAAKLLPREDRRELLLVRLEDQQKETARLLTELKGSKR
ncbi:MAG: hypothetical protein M0T69_02105 [Deltaproteobacteria bacterium]|nr:hypothetical protein [Deltaproteobacteria bacterium]